MVPATIEKVTAFILRGPPGEVQVLLFRHPVAGIQIPAGTVEEDEAPDAAVLREASEETGLAPARLSLRRYLGHADDRAAEGSAFMFRNTPLYTRPGRAGGAWASLRRGFTVAVERHAPGFTQVTYEEPDRYPDPQYVTMRLTGWVTDDALCFARRRYFYTLDCAGSTPERWTTETDNHVFELFWAPLDALPEIVPPQRAWLEHLRR